MREIDADDRVASFSSAFLPGRSLESVRVRLRTSVFGSPRRESHSQVHVSTVRLSLPDGPRRHLKARMDRPCSCAHGCQQIQTPLWDMGEEMQQRSSSRIHSSRSSSSPTLRLLLPSAANSSSSRFGWPHSSTIPVAMRQEQQRSRAARPFPSPSPSPFRRPPRCPPASSTRCG